MVIVEWGERFPELMPAERVEIRLRRAEGEEREIEADGGWVRSVMLEYSAFLKKRAA